MKMSLRILIGIVALGTVLAVAFLAWPQPTLCTGNALQNDLITCGVDMTKVPQ